MAKELTQAELKALPHVEPEIEDDHDRRYWGPELVLTRCHYTGRAPKAAGSWERMPAGKGRCQACEGTFDLDGDGNLTLHARALRAEEQAEAKLEAVCAALGLDPYSDAAVRARSTLRDSREETIDLMVASALPVLTAALVKRGAAAAAAAAFTDLAALRLGDELERDISDSPHYTKGDEDAPLFSEGFLYPLLGKEAARTVRARFRRLREALGS